MEIARGARQRALAFAATMAQAQNNSATMLSHFLIPATHQVRFIRQHNFLESVQCHVDQITEHASSRTGLLDSHFCDP
jgi:hypothetical protein